MIRKLVAAVCGATLLAAVVVGVVYPTLGANASIPVNLAAWAVYLTLFYGVFWGLSV